jgi:hypothetical protein
VWTGSEYVGECKLLHNSVNDESPPTFFGLGDAVEFFPKVLSKDTFDYLSSGCAKEKRVSPSPYLCALLADICMQISKRLI